MDSGAAIYLRVEGLLDRMNEILGDIADRLETLLSKVPDLLSGLFDGFREKWDAAVAKVEQVHATITRPLYEVGDPGELFGRAEDWKSLIGDPGVAEAARVDGRHELLVDDTWLGRSATVYATGVPAQVEALSALGQISADVSTALKTAAFGVSLFWVGVVGALVELVVGLVAAALSAASVVAAPAVPFELIGAALSALVTVGGALVMLWRNASTAEESLANQARFMPEWPRLVG